MTEVASLTRVRGHLVPELDGVRGIAILLVLLFHFGARPPAVPRIVTAPFSVGWMGVDLFFALSGFLITGILLDATPAANYFSSFYIRRALRVAPLYFLAVAAFFLVALPTAHSLGHLLSEDNSLQWWFWFNLSNWPSAFGNDVLQLKHFWSLAIEEQFYLLWPVVVFLITRSRLAYVCLGIIFVSLGLRIAFADYTTDPQFLGRLTPFRVDSLAFGGLVATIVEHPAWCSFVRIRLLPISSVFIAGVLAAFAVEAAHVVPGPIVATVGVSFIAAAFSCLIFFAKISSGSAGWLPVVLRAAALRSLGKYSYAMYVVHGMLFDLQNGLVLKLARDEPATVQMLLWMSNKVAGVGISYLAALITWNLVEKHFLKLKAHFAPQAGSHTPERVSAAAL